MNKKSQKSFMALGTAILASVLYLGQGFLDTSLSNENTVSVQTTGQYANAALTANFVDVGQADAIVLQSGSHAVLVDAGNRADEEVLKAYIDQLGITQFDLVVATHAHEDHIGSMAAIIEAYPIESFLMPKETHDTKTFERMQAALSEKKVPVKYAKSGQVIDLGNAKLTVLAPNSKDYEDRNNESVVLMVEAGGEKLLLTGDAETESEHEMVAKWGETLKADVLKVGHHGSGTSTTAQFLKLVAPKTAVISVGEGNNYNHPDELILNRLKKYGVDTVYRTDLEGTVVIAIGNQ